MIRRYEHTVHVCSVHVCSVHGDWRRCGGHWFVRTLHVIYFSQSAWQTDFAGITVNFGLVLRSVVTVKTFTAPYLCYVIVGFSKYWKRVLDLICTVTKMTLSVINPNFYDEFLFSIIFMKLHLEWMIPRHVAFRRSDFSLQNEFFVNQSKFGQKTIEFYEKE